MRVFDPALVTAAILAGGQGRRLGGRDKGLEPLHRKPLIEHVIAALHEQAGSIVICANRNLPDYARFGRVIGDAKPGFHGPLAGIARALGTCMTSWLLTVPVDCPQPPMDLARRLFAAAAPVAVARNGQRREPLFALYRRELATTAGSALTRDLPVWRWQNEVEAVEVDFSGAAQAFFNLNTAMDFRQWESRHER